MLLPAERPETRSDQSLTPDRVRWFRSLRRTGFRILYGTAWTIPEVAIPEVVVRPAPIAPSLFREPRSAGMPARIGKQSSSRSRSRKQSRCAWLGPFDVAQNELLRQPSLSNLFAIQAEQPCNLSGSMKRETAHVARRIKFDGRRPIILAGRPTKGNRKGERVGNIGSRRPIFAADSV